MSVIDNKYRALGGKRGFLGEPVSVEKRSPDRVGYYRHYRGGSIYWHPSTGAHEIHGEIRNKWASLGWEKSLLGYPTSDEINTPDSGRCNRFQKGFIAWTEQRGAHAIGDSWVDSEIDIEQVKPEFYKKMKEWYGIDLKTNIERKTNARKYLGWQLANFSKTKHLNGYRLSRLERLVLTVGRIILMQWHFRDLKNNDRPRKGQIDKYFKRNHAFKQRKVLRKHLKWRWRYNEWCSEFVSYVYKSAGMPIYYGKRQGFFAKSIGRYEKIGWCVSKYAYLTAIFRKAHKYVKIKDVKKYQRDYAGRYHPQIGDYLRGKDHSMLILGTKYGPSTASAPRTLELLIVDGNVGSGKTESKNKGVRVGYRSATDSDLRGVGRFEIKP